jgi:hypothetical protein
VAKTEADKEKVYFSYDNAARSDLRILLRGEALLTPQAFVIAIIII